MKFNEKLLDLRKKKGWSQEELGYKLDVSRQTISKWESGQTTPELEKLKMLSKLFEISVDELISEEEKAKENYVEKDKNLNNDKKSKNKKSKIKFLFIYLFIVLLLLYIILVAYRYSIIVKIGDCFWGLQGNVITEGYYMEKRTYGSNFNFSEPLTNNDAPYSNGMTKEEHFYYNNLWGEWTSEDAEISRVKIKKYDGNLQKPTNLVEPKRIIYIDKLNHHGYSESEISETTEFNEESKTYRKIKENNYVPYYYIIMGEYESMFNTLDYREDWSNYIYYAMDLRIDISKTKDGDYYMSNVKLKTSKQEDNCYILINDTRVIFEKIVYDKEMKANYTGTRYKLRIGDIDAADVEFPNFEEYTEVQ